MSRNFFDRVYGARGADALRAVYDAHAADYDAELARADYATPARIAAALAAHVADRAAPVLDFACGTGLSGAALHAAGFTTLDGLDVSAGMLAQARAKGLYRALFHVTPDAPVPGGYAAAVACGAIGAGAAPAHCLDRVLAMLPRDGLFVFSFNDHTLADAGFMDHLQGLVSGGAARTLWSEHGPHLPALDLQATVYVLEKL